MLSRNQIERLRTDMEADLVGAIESTNGSHIVNDGNGEEWEYKWRDGEAAIFVEDIPDFEDDPVFRANYVFKVKVELIHVELA